MDPLLSSAWYTVIRDRCHVVFDYYELLKNLFQANNVLKSDYG